MEFDSMVPEEPITTEVKEIIKLAHADAAIYDRKDGRMPPRLYILKEAKVLEVKLPVFDKQNWFKYRDELRTLSDLNTTPAYVLAFDTTLYFGIDPEEGVAFECSNKDGETCTVGTYFHDDELPDFFNDMGGPEYSLFEKVKEEE